MSPSGPLARALTTILALGAGAAACAPSSNTGRAPRAVADSAPESAQESPVPAQPASPIAPDEVTESPPDVTSAPTPPPRPPVAARPVYVPRPTGPYRVRVVDQSHHDLPTFVSGGRTYVMGTVGARYSIVVANPTSRRVEVVLSVDGLDAMDGQPADYVGKRGYILPAYGDVTVDGFRTSLADVATFRFSSVANSYAGRLGQARDVGVIGAAFFPEQAPVAVAPPMPPRPIEAPRHARAQPSQPHPAPDDLADQPYGSGASGPSSPTAQAETRSGGGGGADTSASPAREPSPRKRPGLGTEFGEERESPVALTEFARANPAQPSQVVAIRYNDRAGLIAIGIAIPQPYAVVETDMHLRETADPFRANRFAQPPP